MEKVDYNKMANEVHNENVKKGFYDKDPDKSMTLLLVVSELMEMIEADRKGNNCDSIKKLGEFRPSSSIVKCDDIYKAWFETYVKDTIEDEAADVVIRLLDYAGWMCIDLTISDILIYMPKDLSQSVWVLINQLSSISLEPVLTEDENTGRLQVLFRNSLSFFVGVLKIDIWKHVELKRRYNKLRPHKNGKAY